MPIAAILEVGIGLAFTYLLISLIATWLNEWIASIFNLRATDLKEAIKNLLKDPPEYLKDPEKYEKDHPEYKSFVERFYGHSLVKALSKQKDGKVVRLPAYIPSRTFASVAFEAFFPDEDDASLAEKTKAELEELIKKNELLHPDTRDALLAFSKSGATSIKTLRSSIETWFNDTMDRLSGWYKRRAQWISLIIGLVLAVGLNIDTVVVTEALWREPELRAGVTAYVEESVSQYAPEGEQEDKVPVDDIRRALASLELPFGWTTYGPKTSEMRSTARQAGQNEVLAVALGWLLKGVGWLLTGLAVSQGAPFWFDLLSKIVSLRSSGVVPKVEEETKELKEVLEKRLKEVEDHLRRLEEKVPHRD